MDIPLTDHKVPCYDGQLAILAKMFFFFFFVKKNKKKKKAEPKISPPPIQSLFEVFCIKIKLCIIFTKGCSV